MALPKNQTRSPFRFNLLNRLLLQHVIGLVLKGRACNWMHASYQSNVFKRLTLK